MKGPRRIVDLDHVPRDQWHLDDRSMFMWRGKLWSKEPIGCVLCVEKEGSEFGTLCTIDEHGVERFHCAIHGELVAVEYVMRKIYYLKIGTVIREGEEGNSDVMLFPAETTLAARNELIEKLLDEAQDAEVAKGTT